MGSDGSLGALRSVWSNEAVRRAQLALAGSTIGDWSYGVAISVLVYNQAGAAWVGIAQVCRLVPAAIAAPFLASFVDRYSKQRVLFTTDAVRATIMSGILACAALGAPLIVLLALATASTLVSTMFWPAQGAMLPTLVRDPEELTVANVASSTVTSSGCVIGPALGAGALALFGTTLAFVVPIVAYTLSAAAITRVRPLIAEHPLIPDSNAAQAGSAASGNVAEESSHGVLAGLSAIVRNGDVRVLVGLYGAQVLISGALNVLTVVAALRLLHTGDGGVGALLAAIGVGGLLGAVPALALSRRLPLTTLFACGLVLWGAPLAVVGLAPDVPVALLVLALVGVGNTLVDVSAITLLQRATPAELLGRVFGVLESVVIASVAVGAALAPVLLRLAGTRATFVIIGVLLPIVTAALWPSLRRLDAPVVEPRLVELLRRDAIFAPLPEAIVETLARSLEPVSLAAGDVLFRAGDAGDRYYLIDAGSMLVEPVAQPARILGVGEGFGEIALIRGVPRTASATAETPVSLYALRGDEFVSAVTGHATSVAAADAVIASRLHSLRPALASA